MDSVITSLAREIIVISIVIVIIIGASLVVSIFACPNCLKTGKTGSYCICIYIYIFLFLKHRLLLGHLSCHMKKPETGLSKMHRFFATENFAPELVSSF